MSDFTRCGFVVRGQNDFDGVVLSAFRMASYQWQAIRDPMGFQRYEHPARGVGTYRSSGVKTYRCARPELVARIQAVGRRRFPAASACGWEDKDFRGFRFQNPTHAVQHRAGSCQTAVNGGRSSACNRLADRFWHVCRAGMKTGF
jgi:hypothetical protein